MIALNDYDLLDNQELNYFVNEILEKYDNEEFKTICLDITLNLVTHLSSGKIKILRKLLNLSFRDKKNI